MIPKVIHQSCEDPAALPAELHENMAALRRLNPGWEHCLHARADMLRYLSTRLDADAFAQVRRINPRCGSLLSDIFRYVLCHEHGGVFLNIRSTATRPLAEVLRDDDAYLLSQWRNAAGQEYAGWGVHRKMNDVPGGEYQNWHIVCEPTHPFLAAVIPAAIENIRRYSAADHGTGYTAKLDLCGNHCYTRAIHPIRHLHPHRQVDILSLGFRFSIYRPHGLLTHRDGGHHAGRPEPIVLPGD